MARVQGILDCYRMSGLAGLRYQIDIRYQIIDDVDRSRGIWKGRSQEYQVGGT